MNYFLFKILIATQKTPTGFSLLEILFTTVLIGIIASIGFINLSRTLELQNLKNASSAVYQAIYQAQIYSMQRKEYWQASFRMYNGNFQYAYHPATTDPSTLPINSSSNQPSSSVWTNLSGLTTGTNQNSPIQMYYPTTTIISHTYSPSYGSTTIYEICFTDQGIPSTAVTGTGTWNNTTQTGHNCNDPALFNPPVQITMYSNNLPVYSTGPLYQRCVTITNLLGALRAGQDQPTGNCY